MEQICLTCKKRYQDDEVFCEECGGELVPATNPWRKYAIIGLGGLLIVTGIATGIGYVKSDVRNNIKFELTQVTYANGVIQVDGSVENDSMADVSLDSVACSATVFGVHLGCDSPITPGEIPKGKSTPVTLKVALSAAGTSPSLLSSVQGTQVKVHVWGFPVTCVIDPVTEPATLLQLDKDQILTKVLAATNPPPVAVVQSQESPKRAASSSQGQKTATKQDSSPFTTTPDKSSNQVNNIKKKLNEEASKFNITKQ